MGNDRAEREKRSNPRTTSKPQKGASASNYTPVVWATVQFTPEQKVRIKETECDVAKIIDNLAAMVQEGHKVSFNPCTSDGFIGISVWGHTEQCPNKGFGVSGEGGGFYSALKSLAFKLDILQYDLRVGTIEDENDFR